MPRRDPQINTHQPPRHRLPVLLPPPATSFLHHRIHQLRRRSRQQPIGHGPRAAEPGNGSHSCAATGPDPSLGLAHFPHTGHPWPGQQWQSNPRGLARTPASEPKSSPPTGPAGDARQPWNPRADQSAGVPYMNPRPLDPQNVGLGALAGQRIRAARHDVQPCAGWLAARMACGPQVVPAIERTYAMLAVVVWAEGAVPPGARVASLLSDAQTMVKDAILDEPATGGDSDYGQSGRCSRAAGSRRRVDRRAGAAEGRASDSVCR